MKKTLQIFFIISLLVSVNYAQKIEKVTPEEYVNYLQKIKKEYITKGRTNEIDLKKAKKMVFLAYHTDPIPIKQMLWYEWTEIEKKYRKGDREFNDKIFQERKYSAQEDILSLMKDLIDTLEFNLIEHIELMVRGKVIDKKIIVEPVDTPSRLPPIKWLHLKIQVEDYLIGNALYNNKNNNEVLEIRINSRWVHEGWEISKTYLFNLRYWEAPESTQKPHILTYGKDGVFPIKNEILFDKTNFFKFGEKVEWNDFKKNINVIVNNILK